MIEVVMYLVVELYLGEWLIFVKLLLIVLGMLIMCIF